MNVDAYLERIRYAGLREPTAETLRNLQLNHLYHVPFENLDIGRKVPIVLERPALYNKIVVHRRGGFCYEVNGMFSWLLTELGFDVTLLSAHDIAEDGTLGLEFDHLTLLVKCPAEAGPGTPWLADVGWGDTFRQPLRLDVSGDQTQGSRIYRIESDGEYRTLLQNHNGSVWEKAYHFTLQPRAFSDFRDMCEYHQTSPKSIFTQKSMITLALPNGRVTLNPDRFILTLDGQRSETPVTSRQAYDTLLQDTFGIRFPEQNERT